MNEIGRLSTVVLDSRLYSFDWFIYIYVGFGIDSYWSLNIECVVCKWLRFDYGMLC